MHVSLAHQRGLAAPSLHLRAASTASWHIGTQRRQVGLLLAAAILASLLSAVLVMRWEFVPAVALFIWLALMAVVVWPRVGLFLAFGMVLLFEDGGADPLMTPGHYFFGTAIGSIAKVEGTLVTGLELLLLLSLSSWLIQGMVSRKLDYRGGNLGWPMLLFSLSLVMGLIWGVASGGNAYIAFWEARALFSAVVCYVLAANTIRTRQHVRALVAITLVATGAYAVEGAYRHVALISTGQLGVAQEFSYAHEVSVFLGSLVLLVLAQHVVGAPLWQRIAGPAFASIGLFTLLASQRRAGQIALMVAFLAFALVFLAAYRKAFFAIVLPALVAGAIYVPLFWNNTGLVGQPARAIRSLYAPDPRDAASNNYRDSETINVRAGIDQNPLLGVGFGREFPFVVPLPSLEWWEFWRYEPHHNILWVWLKTGGVGFTVFWVLMGTAIARAAHFARTLRGPELRTFALLALASVIGVLVFSYVDLGLVNTRVTVILGTLLGTLAVLDRLHATRVELQPSSGTAASQVRLSVGEVLQ